MKKLFAVFTVLFAATPVFAANPVVSGIDTGNSSGSTAVTFQGGSTGYTVTFDRLVLVFDRQPPEKYLAMAEKKADSHGRGTVWLVPAAEVNGAEFQLLGLGKEWKKVVKSAPIQGGSVTVEMPYLGENSWQLSIGKIVLSDGTWAWASKGWPHEKYETYDACGNPLNVWGAGKRNFGSAVTPEVAAYIKANLPCPAGQIAKK